MQEVFIEVSKAVLQSVIRKVCIFIILWNMFIAGREKSLRCRRLPEWKVSVRVRKRKNNRDSADFGEIIV